MDYTAGGHEQHNHRWYKKQGPQQKGNSHHQPDLGADPPKSNENGDIDDKLFENLPEIIGYRLGIHRRRFQIATGGSFQGFKGVLDDNQPQGSFHQ